jgi:MFS family permease
MTTKEQGNAEVLKNRSLWIIGIAESVSNTGSWITMIAVFTMLVFNGSGGVRDSGTIIFVGLVPALLAGPLAGRLCDRFDRRALMVGSELLSAFAVLGIIFTNNHLLIFALLAFQAATNSLMTPARQSVIPKLVRPENLTKANALLQQLAGIVKIGAPVAAGAVVALLNPHNAIALDVVSYIVSAILLSRLPHLPASASAPNARDADRSRAGKARAVIATVVESGALRLVFAATFIGIINIISLDVLIPVFVRDTMHEGQRVFGILIACVGAGTLAAAAYLSASKRTRSPRIDLALGIALLAFLPGLFAAAQLFFGPLRAILPFVGAILGGVGNGLIIIQAATIVQTSAPADRIGIVSGAFQSTTVAGQLVGMLLTPVIVPALLSAGGYFVINSGVLLVLAVVVATNRERSSFSTKSAFQAE